MKHPVISNLCLLLTGLFFCCTSDLEPATPKVQVPPPFNGTIFLDPDILTSSDPTTFTNLTYAGQAQRKMFDRRVNDWITTNPFLFKANYTDGLSIEFQINPEFKTVAEAEIQALKYAEVFGRLPTALRKDVKTSWIHLGTQPFGGGNNNLLIHIGQSTLYEKDGILEETLVHEAAHTSLDAAHAASSGWIKAQNLDPGFISTYARDNPKREDVAETFLLYLAIRYRSERISSSLKDKTLETIPNRIKYFDAQNFNMYPIK
ncbi:MAG: hypothetical protein ACK5BR_04450 [Bacteroidota bacterium]|jgi:hypothetical protein|nr:hypothetical protein [Algoriphagus sp.]